MLMLIAQMFMWHIVLAASPTCLKDQQYKVFADLRASMGPVNDQGKAGWCYAYTGADLISHRLKRAYSARAIAFQRILHTAQDKKTSVEGILRGSAELQNMANRIRENEREIKRLYVQQNILKKKKKWTLANHTGDTITFAEDQRKLLLSENVRLAGQILIKDNTLNGSPQKAAIELAFKQGLCTEEDVPSGPIEYRKAWRGPKEYYNSLGGDKGIAGLSDLGLLAELYAFKLDGRASQVCRSALAAHLLGPTKAIQGYQEIFAKLDVDPITAVLDACRGRVLQPEVRPEVLQDAVRVNEDVGSGQARLYKTLDEVLKGDPVAVGIAANIFDKIDPVFREKIPETDKPYSHAVTVVGKAWSCKMNEEVYIIRNSWGKEACKTRYENFIKDQQIPPYDCDQDGGNFIIPKKVLSKGLEDITYLK